MEQNPADPMGQRGKPPYFAQFPVAAAFRYALIKPSRSPSITALDVAVFIAGAVVLHQRVGHEDVGADLAAPFDLLLLALDVFDLIQVFPLFDLHQLGFQHAHGHFPVLVLAALVLAGHDDARGDVGDADGGFRLVDVLAARAAGAVGVHFQILRADLNVHIVGHLGHHFHRGKGGVAAAGSVKGRDPHQPVHAHFAFQIAKGVLPLDEDVRAFDARFFPVR